MKANYVIGECTYGDKPELKIRKKERDIELKYLKELIHSQVIDKNGKVLIQKTGDTKGDCKESISVAAFTEYLFGAEEECIDDCTTLSGETKNLLKNICPLSKNCIMEIV